MHKADPDLKPAGKAVTAAGLTKLLDVACTELPFMRDV